MLDQAVLFVALRSQKNSEPIYWAGSRKVFQCDFWFHSEGERKTHLFLKENWWVSDWSLFKSNKSVRWPEFWQTGSTSDARSRQETCHRKTNHTRVPAMLKALILVGMRVSHSWIVQTRKYTRWLWNAFAPVDAFSPEAFSPVCQSSYCWSSNWSAREGLRSLLDQIKLR